MAEAIKAKEQFGKVCTDYDADMKTAQDPGSDIARTFALPGGKFITLTTERLKCPELLFAFNLSPSLM